MDFRGRDPRRCIDSIDQTQTVSIIFQDRTFDIADKIFGVTWFLSCSAAYTNIRARWCVTTWQLFTGRAGAVDRVR